MTGTLWISTYEDLNNVVVALVRSGYTVRQVTKPNPEYPITLRDYGVEIVEEPK